ncbi:hypothetical protein B2D07_15860 [Desulfococcus multivorans]|nr:uncharacterized protein Dmul_31700 [Desulfococcus multivorans]AQV02091.2 hypothetical protein B2D07_15860 [Desulfococcus multivorans]
MSGEEIPPSGLTEDPMGITITVKPVETDMSNLTHRKETMTELSREQTIQLISTIVAKHGCEILEMDVDNHILDIDGPAEARENCARELELFLD